MAEQNITIQAITISPTTISNKNSLSVLNGSASEIITIGVSGSGQAITLTSGQTITLNASTGFTLPKIIISGTSLSAQVISS